MPWSKQTLALPASPSSVRRARDWATRVLNAIGRPELAENARLAVSELVTNALMHGEPPITVHVRGTTEHPRVEVSDQSLVPPASPRLFQTDVDDELTWTTGGRGLGLVATHSIAWGADIDPRGLGKIVWFEPSAEAHDEPALGAIFHLDEAIEARGGPLADPASLVDLVLLNFPVELFSHLRLHFNEVGRELRLLSLTNPERYPLAVEFSEIYLQVEHERRQVRGLDALDRALAAGLETIDLHYAMPASAPATMARLSDLLDEIYWKFAEDTLLAVMPHGELLDLQHWYLGEFAAQAAGRAPTPWRGPSRLGRRQDVS